MSGPFGGEPMEEGRTATQDVTLGRQVRRGLAWSVIGGIVLRSGNVLTGIILARLLAPQVFGVYAVALTVQGLLMTFADLGLTADLVKSADFRRRAPTVTTLSTLAGGVLTVGMIVAAKPLSSVLGTPSAEPVIQVLAFTLLLAGIGVEPYSAMLRDFDQKKLFLTNSLDFTVSTVVTVALVLAGWGPMALAVARLCGHGSAMLLQFALTRTKLRFGLDREVVRSSVQFGAPVAAVNLITVLMLGLDNIIIARIAGEVALGFYVLAFNISNWPTTIIGNAISKVSLPAFARTSRDEVSRALEHSLAMTWSAALLIGVCLAAMSQTVVVFLYGAKWAPSGDVLAVLGVFGGTRVAADLVSNFLFSQGRSRSVMVVNIVSIAVLIPALIYGTRLEGILGGAAARLLVGLLITAPGLFFALRVAPGAASAAARATWLPAIAAVPAFLVGFRVSTAVRPPILALLAGGASTTAVFVLLIFVWLRPRLAFALSRGGPAKVGAQ